MKTQWNSLPGDSLIGGHADSDNAYLRLLIEHSPVAIVILDSSHRALHCNPIFERMFGYTRTEIVNRNFDELIAFEDTLAEARRCTLSVLHGEKMQMVSRRRRKDGVWIDVDIHGIPLIVDGRLRGVYGLYVDITEQPAPNVPCAGSPWNSCICRKKRSGGLRANCTTPPHRTLPC
jgi:PAS domain S-box-containing protein